MINFIEGNLLESNAEAIINTVNTVGVMGKGIALQFKKSFPNNYKLYKKACENNEIKIGEMFLVEDENLILGKKIIINFPTKEHWKNPSNYEFIEKGLDNLKKIILEKNIKSIAIPPLGAGNGGLDWHVVKKIIVDKLSGIKNIEFFVYEPGQSVQEILNEELVKLTPARAMLLSVLYDLVKNGEFVSEFASEKIAYFLQKFGAKSQFNLEFQPKFYGPYSGKVKHVLYYLNGSFLYGYSSKDKKPFEEIGLYLDKEDFIENYFSMKENKEFYEIAKKTKVFLHGFYSSYGLELLSSIDFIINDKKIQNPELISEHLKNWSKRKEKLFANPEFIQIALNRINEFN